MAHGKLSPEKAKRFASVMRGIRRRASAPFRPWMFAVTAAAMFAGCCLTARCAARSDAQWMRSTCRPIPTEEDEAKCIGNVQSFCVRNHLPEDCGEKEP